MHLWTLVAEILLGKLRNGVTSFHLKFLGKNRIILALLFDWNETAVTLREVFFFFSENRQIAEKNLVLAFKRKKW